MSKNTFLTCDECGAREATSSAVNWMELRPIGIEARAAEQKPLEGQFCSALCVVRFLEEQDGGE